jgi:hypothetical protein
MKAPMTILNMRTTTFFLEEQPAGNSQSPMPFHEVHPRKSQSNKKQQNFQQQIPINHNNTALERILRNIKKKQQNQYSKEVL